MGLIYPLEKFCVVCDRPEYISLVNGHLHNENNMAIRYRDGWGVYVLNGVRVNKEIVETSADRIPVKWILEENNAQVRTEIVKKVGIERLIKETDAKLLEQKGLYKLYNLTLGDENRRWFYLKMINPSTEEIHFEGVGGNCQRCRRREIQGCKWDEENKGCDTIKKALYFRNGVEESPIQLT